VVYKIKYLQYLQQQNDEHVIISVDQLSPYLLVMTMVKPFQGQTLGPQQCHTISLSNGVHKNEHKFVASHFDSHRLLNNLTTYLQGIKDTELGAKHLN
jgi:hypothetical protein